MSIYSQIDMSEITQAVNLLLLNLLPWHGIYNPTLLYKAVPLPLVRLLSCCLQILCLLLFIACKILDSSVYIGYKQS